MNVYRLRGLRGVTRSRIGSFWMSAPSSNMPGCQHGPGSLSRNLTRAVGHSSSRATARAIFAGPNPTQTTSYTPDHPLVWLRGKSRESTLSMCHLPAGAAFRRPAAGYGAAMSCRSVAAVLSLIPPVTVVPDAAPTGSAVCGVPGRFAGHRWSRLADRLNRLDRIWVNVGVPQGARHPI